MAQPRLDDDYDHVHAFVDTSARFSADQRLRRAGYRIIARPKLGHAIWLTRDGELLPQPVALARVAQAAKGEMV